ncbi:MAG: hypothetical protein K9N51_05375 [Candidatus Pacebacteria bacterium]|nr:hypothetical protein [Candidatus Paceibacterota bacterium]
MLRAGVASRDISPPPGLELAGYPHHPRHNKGVHDPLTAACLVLDNGKTKLAVITLDLLMVSKNQVATVRADIEAKTRIPAGNIMICCSHTHSGPWTSARIDIDALDETRGADPDYMQSLHDKLVALATEAAGSMFSARIGAAKGFCGREQGVGGNRRDPMGIADPEVWTIGVQDTDGTWRAVLVKYALHPTFLHSDNFEVSADYPGTMRAYFAESRPDAVFLFMQGTSGNQSPRYFRSGKTFAEAERVGRAIASEADRVLGELEMTDTPDLLVASREIEIPLRQLPSKKEAEAAAERAKADWENAKDTGLRERDVWNKELLFLGAEDTLGFVLTEEAGGRGLRREELPPEIQIIGIDDLRIVGLPGEAFVEFGLTIQYRAPFTRSFAIELANGCLPGYACTAKAYAAGGYETGAPLLTAKSGEVMVDAAVDLLYETKC